MKTVEVAKGQDFAIEVRVLAGDGHGKPINVTLTADAAIGAESLSIKPDHPAFASGDMLLFGEDTVIVLDEACAAGDPTMGVVATTFPMSAGTQLDKISDLTNYTSMKCVVLAKRGDAAVSAVIADSALAVTKATQSGIERGKATIVGLAAATASKEPGSYYGAFWLRDSGAMRPFADFTFKLVEAGEDGFA